MSEAKIDSQPTIEGKWTHNSFLIDPTKHTAEPWAVDGKLTAHSGDNGSFNGKLVFSPRPNIILKVEGTVTAGEASDPISFEATGKGQKGTPLAPIMPCSRRRGSPSSYQAVLSGAADLISSGF